jgi:hypothetical protein
MASFFIFVATLRSTFDSLCSLRLSSLISSVFGYIRDGLHWNAREMVPRGSLFLVPVMEILIFEYSMVFISLNI